MNFCDIKRSHIGNLCWRTSMPSSKYIFCRAQNMPAVSQCAYLQISLISLTFTLCIRGKKRLKLTEVLEKYSKREENRQTRKISGKEMNWCQKLYRDMAYFINGCSAVGIKQIPKEKLLRALHFEAGKNGQRKRESNQRCSKEMNLREPCGSSVAFLAASSELYKAMLLSLLQPQENFWK